MRRLMLQAGVLAVGSMLCIGNARAEVEYPYCVGVNGGYGSGFVSCGFTTMAQCRETIRGMGGWCQANPYYSARTEPGGDGRVRRGTARRQSGP